MVAIPIPVKVSSKMFLRRSQIIGAELSQNLDRIEIFGDYRCLVFAYGSGVFQQQGQQTKDNMTDFIFCVEVCLCLENSHWWLFLRNLVDQDSEKWHEENLARHPSHYASFARSLP